MASKVILLLCTKLILRVSNLFAIKKKNSEIGNKAGR